MRIFEAPLLLWLTIVTAASANNFVSKHRVCDPTQNSWHPYTGVRIFNDVVYSSPVVVSDGDFSHLVEDPQFSASIVAVHCQDGEPTDAKKLWFVGWGNKEKVAGLASLSSMEAMWNREFCLLDFQKKETCYKVVRRRKYALRKLPLFRAGKIIGGLFQRHPEVESETGMSDPMDDYEVVEDPDKKSCKGCGKKSCSGKCKKPKKKKSGCGKCGKKGCSGKCKKKVPPAPVEPEDPCRGCGETDCQKGECGEVPDTPCPGCNVPECSGKCGKEPKQPCEGCNSKKCKGECGLIEDPIEIISPYPQPSTTYEPDWDSWTPPTTVPEPPIYSPAPGWPEVPMSETSSTVVDYVTVTTTWSESESYFSSESPVWSETSVPEWESPSSSAFSSSWEATSTSESPVTPTSSSVFSEPSPSELPLDPRDSLKEDQPYDDYDDDHYDDGYDDEPYYDDDDDDYPPHYDDDDDDYDYDDDDYDDDFDDPYHDPDHDLDFDHPPPIPDYPPPPAPPVDNDPITLPKPCPDPNCGHKSCQRSRKIEIDIRINKQGHVRRDEIPGVATEDNVESAQWPYPIPYDHPYDNAYPWPHPSYPMGPPVGHRRSRARAKNKHKSYPCDDTGCDNERCLRARRAIEIEIIRAHNASVFSAAQEPVASLSPAAIVPETEYVPQNLLDLFKHFHPPCCEMDCGHNDCDNSRSRIELNIRIREQGGNITEDPLKPPCGINHPPVEDLLPQDLKCLFKMFHPPCKGGGGCGGCNRIELDIRIRDNNTDTDNSTSAPGLEKRHALEDEPMVEAQRLDWFRSPSARQRGRGRSGRQIRETIVSQQEEMAKKNGLMDLHDFFKQKHKEKYGEPCEEIDCGHDECDDMRDDYRDDMRGRYPRKQHRPRPITRNNKGSSTIELDIRINENGTTVKRDLSTLEGSNNTMPVSYSTVVKHSGKARSQQARRRGPFNRYPSSRSRYGNRGGYRRYGDDGSTPPVPPVAPPMAPGTPPIHPPHHAYPPPHQEPQLQPRPSPPPYPYNPSQPQRPVDYPSEPLPGYPGNGPPSYPAPPVRYHPPPPPTDNYPYPLPDGPYPLPSQVPPSAGEPKEPCNNHNCEHKNCANLRRGLSIDIRINNENGTTVNTAQFGSIGPIPLPNFLPVLPLIADNIMNSWVRVARNRVHLMMPLVHSADVLDVQYPQNNDKGWAQKLSVNENYDFNTEARNMAEVMFDNALAKSMDTHSNLTGEVLGVYSVSTDGDANTPREQSLDRVLQDIQVLSPIDQMVALLTQFQREMAPPVGSSQLEEARAKYKQAKLRAKQLANKLSY
ncbi:hypothetical protein CJU90_2462 [Yarrowia sp. C11]|nr:hypothetical protein CJU90_2462 [Yarrowia sp. C11]